MELSVFWNALLHAPGFEKYSFIIYTIRMPRILAALLAGAGLSVSGVLLQSVTANELASPNIIGVNSGAGFFVILFLCFFRAPFMPYHLLHLRGRLSQRF